MHSRTDCEKLSKLEPRVVDLGINVRFSGPQNQAILRDMKSRLMERHCRDSLGSQAAFVPFFFFIIMTMFQSYLHLAIKHVLEEKTDYLAWGWATSVISLGMQVTDCRASRE